MGFVLIVTVMTTVGVFANSYDLHSGWSAEFSDEISCRNAELVVQTNYRQMAQASASTLRVRTTCMVKGQPPLAPGLNPIVK